MNQTFEDRSPLIDIARTVYYDNEGMPYHVEYRRTPRAAFPIRRAELENENKTTASGIQTRCLTIVTLVIVPLIARRHGPETNA